jgi:hypothetical protein
MEKRINNVCCLTETVCLILKINDKMTNQILDTFSSFRDNYLRTQEIAKDFLLEYDNIGIYICELLLADENRENFATIFFGIIFRIQFLIRNGQNEEAFRLYRELLNELKRQYQNGIEEKMQALTSKLDTCLQFNKKTIETE